MKKNNFFIIILALLVCCAPLLNLKTVKADNNQDNGINIEYISKDNHGKQEIFYAELTDYSKSQAVIHTIKSESGSYTLSTVEEIAKDYEEKYNKKVLVAVNGDYFYTSGSPVDSLAIDGSVYTIGNFSHKSAFGFDNKGNSSIGRLLETELACRINGIEFNISKINVKPLDGEIAFYTSASNLQIDNSAKYIFMSSNGKTDSYPISAKSTRASKGSVVDNNALTLTSGRCAIVIGGENEISKYFYDNIKYNDKIEIIKKPAGIYKGMNYVVGGYDKLVENKQLLKTYHTDNGGDSYAPRTMIGIKENGNLFVSVIDGRQPDYSVGITVKEEAEMALEFGAINALELDGGGSSTFTVRENDTLVTKNKPSDGNLRKVSNAVLFIENEMQDEEIENDETKSSTGCKSHIDGGMIFTLLIASYAVTLLVIKKVKKSGF